MKGSLAVVDDVLLHLENEKDTGELITFFICVRERIRSAQGAFVNEAIAKRFSREEFASGYSALGIQVFVGDYLIKPLDVDKLEGFLLSKDGEVRLGAVRLLTFVDKIGDDSRRIIIRIMESDENINCRKAAAMVVAGFPSKEGLASVKRLLNNQRDLEFEAILNRVLTLLQMDAVASK